ncbi:hypothetical protein CPJCM30710_30800 [Clostridium polyendosporum]|uniref:VanZ-like domain-containing protein n=1 Tax=Clostridium polyendosporum TaxID=69208 RepID=A0A919S216_9CLOT|nr:VanZ family protein [Clostridium polyendosporum]GIM30414.1 hypothetical protein CPJCM30710_30800 [Clostridium polyendosporum]
MKKIVILLCLLWMGFIFYMSSNIGEVSHKRSDAVVTFIENQSNELKVQNGGTIKAKQIKKNKLDHLVRKNAHAFEYIVLAMLVSGALFTYNLKGKEALIYVMFICLFYAVTDEFHQSFVPGRTSFISDVLIDFLGAIIGLGLYYLFYYRLYQKYFINMKVNRIRIS